MRMRATAFLARLSTNNRGQCVWHQVGQLQRFHQVRVPDQRAIRDFQIIHLAGDLVIFFTPSASVLSVRNTAASACMVFCISRRNSAVGRAPWHAQTVKTVKGRIDRRLVQRRLAASRSTTSPARIAAARPKTTRSIRSLIPNGWRRAQMHSPLRPQPSGPERRSWVFLVGFRTSPQIVRRNAAHVVVHGRQDRDRLFGHDHACKDSRDSEIPGRRQARASAGKWFRFRWM